MFDLSLASLLTVFAYFVFSTAPKMETLVPLAFVLLLVWVFVGLVGVAGAGLGVVISRSLANKDWRCRPKRTKAWHIGLLISLIECIVLGLAAALR
jgi:hypothetical protein